jgi:hypothetical protein
MSPESYSWIVVVVAPVSSLAIAGIFLYGALFSRFRLAFSLIALGGVFFLLSQLYWLAAKLQQSLGIALLSRESFRLLFPIQALSLYVGLAVALTGDVLLVWQVSKPDAPRHT